MKLVKDVLELFNSVDKRIRIATLAVAFLLVLFTASKVAFWALVFIFAASVAEVYNAYVRTPLHFDLVKVGTILTAAAYGAPVGIFVGLASTFFAKLFSMRLDLRIAISFAGIILIAILADAFSGAPIKALGISLVAVYYLVTSPINLLLGEEPAYAAVYVGSSLAVNAVLFMAVAPKLAGLLN
ncbi:hypothetical protein HYU20_02025 [Candidatus Woesearchaeota archaeon]|nr:hypothetical protein [Candidatus Woesearchaeota archaeon]